MELLRDRRVGSALAVGLIGSGLAWVFLRSSGGPEPIKLVEVPTPPPPIEVVESLQRGQTLGQVLENHGIVGNAFVDLVGVISEYESPRRLRPGTEITFAMRPDDSLSRISLKLDRDRTLHLLAGEGVDASWGARLDSVRIRRDTIVVAGVAGATGLYEVPMLGDGADFTYAQKDVLLGQLAQIYAWQIDFWRDLRQGDAYRFVAAREVRPDGTFRVARILAAEFSNRGRLLTAVRFQPDESQPIEFYDEEGEALRGQFLLAPLDVARVTSGFSMRRFHPVLRRNRPHLGIDYGASRGTPVFATGGGVVTRAGAWGGYGTAIEVRHANNLRTRYAHLSGIARGVRSGVRVQQGQVIGYVGSSGLATGSHLHYEFLRNGSHVNPARMQFPRAEPVANQHRELFMAQSAYALSLLQRLEMPVASGTARTQD